MMVKVLLSSGFFSFGNSRRPTVVVPFQYFMGALLVLVVSTAWAQSKPHAHHKAHAHGQGELELAIEKELRRAERFGHPLAFLLLDIDRLSDLNVAHGYGFGDRILERIGIVMRSYFREHDWVARHGEDSIAVLLPETPTAHAEPLAEQVRKMVEERLALQDHRTSEAVPVTVSVAVLVADAVSGPVTSAHVLTQAGQALMRAKVGGRNRVERIEMPPVPGGMTPEQRRRSIEPRFGER